MENLQSIINNSENALDYSSPFTYIEFVKLIGEENNIDIFISKYQEYLSSWCIKSKINSKEEIDTYIRDKMIGLLKSITLNYSSYEERDFLANVDWENEDTIKALIPFYVRKLKEITDYYRTKRDSVSQIINKVRLKGSSKSIEEIIYDSIFNFVFGENYEIQMNEIRRNISISIENYVDIYSEYFDIPRDKKPSLASRQEMLSANMNDVDWRNYLRINEAISNILYSGYVYLKEIPLIAKLSLDLSQDCVGELATLRQELIEQKTLCQIPLTEQVALKRKFYEKFLGCTLYYLYCDNNKNVTMDELVRPSNPSGNLLNASNPDTATIESKELKLLSKIGLFFKPDKTSILKVNAKSYTWTIDEDKLKANTFYVFPDPNKYGQIGNNKDENYPLIMYYDLDFDIKNISSGFSCNDPLILLDGQTFSSYYTKQQDEFKIIDNKNYDYLFTSLYNKGIITKYQQDVYGNSFALFKRYEIQKDESGNVTIIINLPSNIIPDSFDMDNSEEFDGSGSNGVSTQNNPLIINGGYFEDPENIGHYDSEGNYIAGKPFDYNIKKTIDDYFHFSGVKMYNTDEFLVRNELLFKHLNFGDFSIPKTSIKFIDHFEYQADNSIDGQGTSDNDIIMNVIEELGTELISDLDNSNIIINQTTEDDFLDIESEYGSLYIKSSNSLTEKPKILDLKCLDKYKNENGIVEVFDFYVIRNTLILKCKNSWILIPYQFNTGEDIKENFGLNDMIKIDFNDSIVSKPLYNESDGCIYFCILYKINEMEKSSFIPIIKKVDLNNYLLTDSVNGFISMELDDSFLLDEHKKNLYFYIKSHNNNYDLYKNICDGTEEVIVDLNMTYKEIKDIVMEYVFNENYNMENFVFNWNEMKNQDVIFSYNNNLNTFLLTYIVYDNMMRPFLYEHTFKLDDNKFFNQTLKTNVYSDFERSIYYSEFLDSGYVKNEDFKSNYFFEEIT